MSDLNVPSLVRGVRSKLKLTQEQLAHTLGVSFSTVNQWENGHRRPQPFLVNALLELAAKARLRPRGRGALR